MKMSRNGRELGEEGFWQIKQVHWDIEAEAKGYYYPY
jgi:hypothetical protein